MLRTFVTPKNTDLHLSIPQDYVGKEVEVLVYATDELKEKKSKAKKVSSLKGKLKLSAKQSKEFHQYAKEIRNEWDRAI